MKDFFIKGTIFITDISKSTRKNTIKNEIEEYISKIYFEVIEEEFFHFGFTKQQDSLSQSDIDVTLEYNLSDFIDSSTLEIGKYYNILWNFDFHCYQDYYGESDCDIMTEKLEVIEITNPDLLKYLNQGVEREFIKEKEYFIFDK
jgi:hypothetical protein